MADVPETRLPTDAGRVRRTGAALILLVLLTLSAPVGARDSGAIFEEAEAALQAGDLPAAIRLYREAVDLDPTFRRAWKGLGLALSWSDRLDEALQAYDRALALAPEDLTIRLDLARVHSWKGDLAASLQQYDNVLGVQPGNRESLLGKARVLGWDGRYDEARAVYGQLPAQDPEARLGRARLLAWEGNLRQAERALRELLQEGPASAEVELAYAQVRSWQGMDGDASEHARRAGDLPEAKRLLRRLDLQQAPTLSPLYASSLDSDGNALQTTGLHAGFQLDPQVRARVGFENLHAFNGTQGLQGDARIASAGLTARLSPELAVSGQVATVTTGRSTTVGGGELQWSPTDRDHVTALASREVVLGTAELARNDVTMETVGLGFRHDFGQGSDVFLSTSTATFSDGNRRQAWLGSFRHTFQTAHPRVTLGATHRAFTFAERTRSGYFNPPRLALSEVFVDVVNDDLEDPWVYGIGLAAGTQRIDVEAPQFAWRVKGLRGYRFSDSFTLQASGLVSTQASSSITGFRYQQAVIQGVFRF